MAVVLSGRVSPRLLRATRVALKVHGSHPIVFKKEIHFLNDRGAGLWILVKNIAKFPAAVRRAKAVNDCPGSGLVL